MVKKRLGNILGGHLLLRKQVTCPLALSKLLQHNTEEKLQ